MEQQKLNFSEERKVYSVTEVVEELRALTEARFRGVWIQGEVSNLRRPSSGHLYFTLKDDDSQISAVCFRMQARYLRVQPEDGLDVLVRGTLSVYPVRGQLQIVVDAMEPLGRGALQATFEELKIRLRAEGLFDEAAKIKLPLLPSRVGVVTSRSGAALQDILRVLKRRNDRVNVLIYPARVQGKEAAPEIAAGIRYLDERGNVDVIIVGRGGGSLEDLWPFNEEVVARAIHTAQTPVISAVGHETDFTIADFVADLRAPTPSAAAEIVSGRREELQSRLSQLTRRLVQSVRYRLQVQRGRLDRLVHSRGFMDARSRVRLMAQRLDDLQLRLEATMSPFIRNFRSRRETASRDLERDMAGLVRACRQRLSAKSENLSAYSPLRVLDRGYAIVTDLRGRVVLDPESIQVEESFHVRVARGEFRARKEGS